MPRNGEDRRIDYYDVRHRGKGREPGDGFPAQRRSVAVEGEQRAQAVQAAGSSGKELQRSQIRLWVIRLVLGHDL